MTTRRRCSRDSRRLFSSNATPNDAYTFCFHRFVAKAPLCMICLPLHSFQAKTCIARPRKSGIAQRLKLKQTTKILKRLSRIKMHEPSQHLRRHMMKQLPLNALPKQRGDYVSKPSMHLPLTIVHAYSTSMGSPIHNDRSPLLANKLRRRAARRPGQLLHDGTALIPEITWLPGIGTKL